MSKIARDPLYRRCRFPADFIAHAVWLYFRCSACAWSRTCWRHAASSSHIRPFEPGWRNLDDILPTGSSDGQPAGSATNGISMNVWLPSMVRSSGSGAPSIRMACPRRLVQIRRNASAANRLMRKLLKAQGHAPRVMITDKRRPIAEPGWISCLVSSAAHTKASTIGRRIRTSRPDDGNGS